MRIAIGEIMHDSAVAAPGERHAVLDDRTLVDRRAELIAQLADAAALAAAQRQSRCRF
ncbi:MAG: hypothetical protein ABI593_06130 [Betaproteobacteria bacterium]